MAKQKSHNPTNSKNLSFLERTEVSAALSLLILVSATLAVYLHTLNAPFYLDDYPSIRDNFSLRDISDLDSILGFSRQRFLGYLSFALNYAIHGYSLLGYHVVNIAIHIGCSATVFFLIRQIVSIDNVRAELPPLAIKWLPLLTALLFSLHPLQIQAVTYIVQRLAVLTALFYLLSVFAYIRLRLENKLQLKIVWASLLLIFAVCALFTKQNSVTLPGALILVEIYLFKDLGRRVFLSGVAVVVLAAGLLLYYAISINDQFFASLSQATIETTLVTRSEYLAIQMGVLWTYIAKAFIPFNLHLDMNVAVSSFANPITWLYATAHVAVLGFAIWCWRRFRLLGFAIVFYYLAHAVESSVIPIRDFAFEHRTYLPNFGMCLMVAYLFLVILPKNLKLTRIEIPITAFLVFISVITWNRNDTWADPEAFFINEIRINPTARRSYGMLGEFYLRQGENEKAVDLYLQGLEIVDENFDRQTNTQLAFYQNTILALDNVQRDAEALAMLTGLPWDDLRPADRSKFLTLRGNIFAQDQKIAEAQSDFEEALSLRSNNFDAKLSYGKVLYMQARMQESRAQFTELLQLDPNNPLANEARALLDAIDEYESAQ